MIKHTQTSFLSVFDNFMGLALKGLQRWSERFCRKTLSLVFFLKQVKSLRLQLNQNSLLHRRYFLQILQNIHEALLLFHNANRFTKRLFWIYWVKYPSDKLWWGFLLGNRTYKFISGWKSIWMWKIDISTDNKYHSI